MQVQIKDKIIAYYKQNPQVSSGYIGTVLNCDPSYVRQVIRDLKSGRIEAEVAPSTFVGQEKEEMTADTWTFETKTQERIKSLDDLVRVFSIDLTIWEVERFIANKWEQNSKQAGTVELYQVKAFMRRRCQKLQNQKEAILEAIEEINSAIKTPNIRTYANKTGGCLLEIAIFDAHFGKLCWEEETGNNYDLKEAVSDYLETLVGLIDKAAPFDIEKIVLIIGNDMINVDSNLNTTTKGTPQDVDSRYFKVVKAVSSLMYDVIENYLLPIAPVEVVAVPGNHDHETTIYLGMLIETFFRGNPNVTVDTRPTTYKFVEYGTNLLMFNHGDKIKEVSLPLILAQQNPEAWGRTTCREVHQGHKHTRIVAEYAGVIVRHIRAMCPTDKYCKENGYVGNVRGGEAYVFDKKHGLVAQLMQTL